MKLYGIVPRACITGTSPVSLSNIGSLVGLCSDIEYGPGFQWYCVVCNAESVPYYYPDFTIAQVDALYPGVIKY